MPICITCPFTGPATVGFRSVGCAPQLASRCGGSRSFGVSLLYVLSLFAWRMLPGLGSMRSPARGARDAGGAWPISRSSARAPGGALDERVRARGLASRTACASSYSKAAAGRNRVRVCVAVPDSRVPLDTPARLPATRSGCGPNNPRRRRVPCRGVTSAARTNAVADARTPLTSRTASTRSIPMSPEARSTAGPGEESRPCAPSRSVADLGPARIRDVAALVKQPPRPVAPEPDASRRRLDDRQRAAFRRRAARRRLALFPGPRHNRQDPHAVSEVSGSGRARERVLSPAPSNTSVR